MHDFFCSDKKKTYKELKRNFKKLERIEKKALIS